MQPRPESECKRLIARFPLVRYIPVSESDADTPAGWEDTELQDVYLESHHARCYYCLSDFQEPQRPHAGMRCTTEKQSVSPSEPLKQLPCGHVFHRSCIDQWLLENQQCAVCRHDIFETPATDGVRPRALPQSSLSQRPRSISLPSAPPTILMLTNPAPQSLKLKPKKSRFEFLSKLWHIKRKPQPKIISSPFDFVHLTHIDFDQDAGRFVGLPKEVEELTHGATLNGIF